MVGEDSTATLQRCTLAAHPDEPAHIEVHSNATGDDGQYVVHVTCVADTYFFHNRTYIETQSTYIVTATDPQEIVERTLANLPTGTPDVSTSPGDGNFTLAGMDTWLMIEPESVGPALTTVSDGPIGVDVWATPVEGGGVTWETGEDTINCPDDGHPPGSCSYTYQRASAEQPHTDSAGRPAYELTASTTYTGGYQVTVYDQIIGGDDDLGEITRSSEPYYLAVAEAQALNTENPG